MTILQQDRCRWQARLSSQRVLVPQPVQQAQQRRMRSPLLVLMLVPVLQLGLVRQ